MQTPPQAAVPTRNVGPPTAPTRVEEHCFGVIEYADVSFRQRYWAGNLHRPRIIKATLTYGPAQARQTTTVARVSSAVEKLPAGTEVCMYVHRMVIPNAQTADEAIMLRGGTNPDAAVTANRLPKTDRWFILVKGEDNIRNMQNIINQHIGGRSSSPNKRAGNSPNRAGARGSPSRSGTAPGAGGAR